MPAAELTFGQQQFQHASLGDPRRTRRLIKSVDQMVRHPGGTLPDKLSSPADLKAFYDLCDRPEVTHAAVLAAHRHETLKAIHQTDQDVLVIHDATELDYTTLSTLKNDLGQIGNGSGRGYVCQNSLAVTDTGDVLGLTQQVLHCRDDVPKREARAQTRDRQSRESRLWIHGTADLPADRRLIDVCDRLADTFEFLEHECRSGRRFVIRSHHDRRIVTGHEGDGSNADEVAKLQTWGTELAPLGTRTVRLAGACEGELQQTLLAVSAGAVRVVPPRQPAGEHGTEPLPLWLVRTWEPEPRPGEEPLEWYLLTNEQVTTLEDAARVVGWYERRWIIEEYHKALKTGCGIETLQFTTPGRMEPAIAVLSVVALTLLKLRDLARRPDAKDRPATEVVSERYVEVLSAWRLRRVCRSWTIHEFTLALARLGGHQNRRKDKRPGWLVLWRGWMKLETMLDGAQAALLIAQR